MGLRRKGENKGIGRLRARDSEDRLPRRTKGGMVNARRVKNAVAPASRSRIRPLGRAAAEGRADT